MSDMIKAAGGWASAFQWGANQAAKQTAKQTAKHTARQAAKRAIPKGFQGKGGMGLRAGSRAAPRTIGRYKQNFNRATGAGFAGLMGHSAYQMATGGGGTDAYGNNIQMGSGGPAEWTDPFPGWDKKNKPKLNDHSKPLQTSGKYLGSIDSPWNGMAQDPYFNGRGLFADETGEMRGTAYGEHNAYTKDMTNATQGVDIFKSRAGGPLSAKYDTPSPAPVLEQPRIGQESNQPYRKQHQNPNRAHQPPRSHVPQSSSRPRPPSRRGSPRPSATWTPPPRTQDTGPPMFMGDVPRKVDGSPNLYQRGGMPNSWINPLSKTSEDMNKQAVLDALLPRATINLTDLLPVSHMAHAQDIKTGQMGSWAKYSDGHTEFRTHSKQAAPIRGGLLGNKDNQWVGDGPRGSKTTEFYWTGDSEEDPKGEWKERKKKEKQARVSAVGEDPVKYKKAPDTKGGDVDLSDVHRTTKTDSLMPPGGKTDFMYAKDSWDKHSAAARQALGLS